MGKSEKLIERWKQSRPTFVRKGEVETVLNRYFKGEWVHDGGSHIVVRNEILKKYKDYQPFGEFTVVIKGGQQVKGVYVKEILKAISLIQEDEEAQYE